MTEFASLAGAALGIWVGSELAVSRARSIARDLGVSELVLGLTVVSVGTSLPEILVSVSAGLRGEGAIALSNIVGSCLSQITAILGLSVLLAGPAAVSRGTVRREGAALLLAIALVAAVAFDGQLARWEGGGLAGLYLLYVGLLLRSARPDAARAGAGGTPAASLSPATGWRAAGLGVGLLILYLSAELLLDSAVSIGGRLGMSKVAIGLITGLSTSLPELSVSVTALRRGAGGLSLGNLVGSNVTDPLLSLGLGALATGYAIVPADHVAPIVAWLFGTVLALVAMHTRRRLDRWEGVGLLGLYVAYMSVAVG